MQQPDIKVIISGGGTGGHIFPALAIANAIKSARPLAEILLLVLKVGWKWKKFLLQDIKLKDFG